jgi:hypothetical protein
MADPFILSHVRRLPLFARLTPQQMEWVADVTQILQYAPGEQVYRQNEPPPGMYMFISGSGTLTQYGADGIERPFGQVNTNEFINETSLFNTNPSPLNLRIAQQAVLLFLSRQQMQSLLAYHPDIKAALTPTAPVAPPPQPQTRPPALSAAANMPAAVRENETVVMQVRKHWWSFGGRIAWLGVALVALWVAYLAIQPTIPGFPWIIIALIGSVFIVGAMIYVYLEWQNDMFVVTDRRVMNIHQTILTFRRESNEIPLDAIHEVAVALPPLMDFVGRLLDYGTVIIRTSGDSNNIVLRQVPNPKNIQQVIFTQRKYYQEGKFQEQQNATRNAIKAEVNKFLIGGGAAGSSPAGGTGTLTTHPGFLSIQYTNEKGETVYRKHYVVWMQHVLLPGMVMLGGVIVLFVGLIGPIVPLLIIVAGAVLVYLADWDWRNDLYIVGDQTVTIIHRRPLFLQDQRDLVALAEVDNVVADVHGLFNTLLQLGDVRLLLTGSETKNAKYFRQVYQPQQIQQEISRRQDRAEQAKRDAEAQRQRQAIVEYLSVYHESVQGNPQPDAPAPQTTNNPDISAGAQTANLPPPLIPETPPRVRDRSRPPGVPRVRRDDPPTG